VLGSPVVNLLMTFIVFTALYTEFCTVVAGRYLHYTPAEASRGATSAMASYDELLRGSMLTKIEALRDELLATTAVIATVDYGAGEPGESLMPEAMSQGRHRQERVCDLCRTRNGCAEDAAFLFRMVRLLRPLRCLELGTGLGVTAAYIGAALELNGGGTLIRIEGCPRLAQLATDNLRRLGLPRVSVQAGRFQDVMPELLRAWAFRCCRSSCPSVEGMGCRTSSGP